MAKNKVRTADEINKQVEGLKKMRINMREFSSFGDPNWKAIDAQISIITGKETHNDYKNAENYVESEAYRAQDWLKGDDDEDLFDN